MSKQGLEKIVASLELCKLEIRGILVFKWSENQIKTGEVVNLSPIEPLFGQRHGKTHWFVFMKPEKEIEVK